MTYNLKGFVKINPKINNAVGTVSQIGELSTYTQTFTREMGEFVDDRYSAVSFVSFLSRNDLGQNVTVTRNFYEHVLDLSQKLYNYCVNFIGVMTKLDVLNFIQSSFFGSVSNLNCGEILNAEGMYMPEWISWSNFTLPTNSIKIWFSDNAMQRQYDDYSVIVIPPIDNIDGFFKPVNELKALVRARTNSQTAELVQVAKQRKPETITRVDDFVYSNPRTPEYTPTLSWTTIIYGSAGNNIDIIKAAIKNYCQTNSAYPLSKWVEIFPDIFKSTEFTIVPLWDQVAIPNRVMRTGIYSPIINPLAINNKILDMYPDIEAQHINTNLQVLGHNYKSLNLAIFGGIDNKNDLFKITDYFPDYINTSTSSVDFARMATETQLWLYFLTELLIIAENPSAISSLPVGVQRITRAGIDYIAKPYNDVQYLIAVKG